MKKLLLLVVVMVMILSVVLSTGLIGCKGTTAETTPTEEETTEAVEEEAVEEEAVEEEAVEEKGAFVYDPAIPVNNGEPIELLIWDAVRSELLDKYIPEYEKIHPNVDVIFEPIGWGNEAFVKVGESTKAGVGPDLVYVHSEWWAQIFSQITTPIPEDVFSLEAIKNNFPQWETCVASDGNIYTLPMDVFNEVFFYNKTLWAEAGLTDADIPKTWDDLMVVAQKLTKYDDSGIVIQAGYSGVGLNQLLWPVLMYTQGKYLFNEDGSRANIDCPEGLKATQYIYDIYYKYKVDDKDAAAWDMFMSGKSAIMTLWPVITVPLDAAAEEVGFEWGAFGIPSWDGEVPPAYSCLQIGRSWGVSKYSSPEKQAVAWDFMKFILTNPDAILMHTALIGSVPGVASLINHPDVLADPGAAVAVAQMDRCIDEGFYPAVYTETTEKHFNNMTTQGLSPEQVVKDLQEELDAEFKNVPGTLEYGAPYKYDDEMRW